MFWHQHEGCKRATVPKSNKEYWIPKLEKNIERQKDNINSILNMGMKSYIVWECEVKDIKIEELLDA